MKKSYLFSIPFVLLYLLIFQLCDIHSINHQIKIVEQDNYELHRAIHTSCLKHDKLLKQIEVLKIEATKPVFYTYQTFYATAYSTRENGDKFSGRWGNVTKLGTKPTQGRTIAVDKKVIPLGSRVHIIFPEPFAYMSGVYIAEDTGSPKKIYQNNVDVYFDSVLTCYDFGHKQIFLRVL